MMCETTAKTALNACASWRIFYTNSPSQCADATRTQTSRSRARARATYIKFMYIRLYANVWCDAPHAVKLRSAHLTCAGQTHTQPNGDGCHIMKFMNASNVCGRRRRCRRFLGPRATTPNNAGVELYRHDDDDHGCGAHVCFCEGCLWRSQFLKGAIKSKRPRNETSRRPNTLPHCVCCVRCVLGFHTRKGARRCERQCARELACVGVLYDA